MKKLFFAVAAISVAMLSSCDTNRTETTTTTQTDRTATISQGPDMIDENDTLDTSLPRDTGAVQGLDMTTFMREAADGNLAEVAHGRLAANKASNAEVKKFGQMMSTDHSKASDQLRSLASAKDISLPTTMSPMHQQMQERLESLSGADFDREYMRHMVSDHEKTVNLFRSASQELQDNDVKQFATRQLPTLQKHLEEARNIAGKVGAR